MTSGVAGSIGLLLDICGAYFIAEGVVGKRREDVLREARSYFDGNPFALRGAVYSALQARVGFVLLLTGFLLQFSTYTTWITQGRNDHPTLTLILAAAISVPVAVGVRKLCRMASRRAMVREWGASMVEALTGNSKPTDEVKLRELAVFYGQALDVKPKQNESTPDLVDRVVVVAVGKPR